MGIFSASYVDSRTKQANTTIVRPKKGNCSLSVVNNKQKALEIASHYRNASAAFRNRCLPPDSYLAPRIGEMNRKELLRLLLNQAQFNGFEFRRWFQSHVRPPGRARKRLSPCWPPRAATTPSSSRTTLPAASGGPALT
jgi:hypothetical protein